jgi:hypothetical protein
LPSSEAPAAVPATPTATANKKPDNASSPPRWHGIVWGALAVVLYLAIADAAVETFLRDSLLRWWIAGAAVLYLALCAAVWRLMPKLWRRLNWANQAGLSLLVLLALMSATVWMPGGLEQGLNLIGQPTSIVLALVTAVVVALSGIFLARLRFVPLAGKIVAGLLAAYGVAAFLLAVNAGTPYPSLFHGASQWTRLPFWLQGATVGALFLVPLALLLEIVTGLRRITRDKMSDFAFKVIALGMSLVITVAAVRMPADSAMGNAADYDSGAVETPPWLSESHEKPLQGEAGYKQASEKLNRLYAGLDVVNSKIDRSLFEIDALADRLGSDPAAMFHFVRDEIRYEPYTGVLRGALGTLLCRAGNSLDRSLLLAALLGKAGFKTQIASGQLNAQQAQILVNRLFEPVKPVPSAVPSLAELAPEVGRAMGVDQAKLLRLSDEMQKYGQRQNKQLIDYVDHESSFLSNLLSKAGVDAGMITSNDQLLAEASLHYWVQYQNPSGQWVDLDSAFTDAEPGKTVASATNTFAPDSIPEELYHHLRVSLTLRVAQVTDGNDGPTSDTVLLDQELRVAEQQGKDIILANSPVPIPKFTTPGLSLIEALAPTKGYQTVLQVGDRVIAGKYFDLGGRVSDNLGGPVGDAVTNAGGVGNGVGGIAGGINGAFGSAPSEGNATRIVGEWADYKLTSPGAAVGGIHDYRRDVIAPVTVQSWSANDPNDSRTVPTKLGKDVLQRRLLWSTELLPVSGAIVPDYVGYLLIKSFMVGRTLLDHSFKLAYGVSSDDALPNPPPGAPIANLSVAAGAMNLIKEIPDRAFASLRSYFGSPGLIAYETGTLDSFHASSPADLNAWAPAQRYDVVSCAPRVVERTGGLADASGRAASLHLLLGVLITRLEWALMAASTGGPNAGPNGQRVLNATQVFAAAEKSGLRQIVLRPGPLGLKDLAAESLPDPIKAEVSSVLASGDTVVLPLDVVNVNGQIQFAWWRFDNQSGELIGIMPGGRGDAAAEQALLQQFVFPIEAVKASKCIWKYAHSKEDTTPAFKELCTCSVVTAVSAAGGFIGGSVGIAVDGIVAIVE